MTEYDETTQKLQRLRCLTLDQNDNMVTTSTPDRSTIIFTSNRSGAFRLYRQAIDQAVPELSGTTTSDIVLAGVAPDGKHLVCMVDTDLKHNAPPGIMLVPLDGGAPRMLLRHPAISDIQCARKPSSLCLMSTVGPGAEVYSLGLEDGTLQKFPIPIKEDFRQWGLSPDGSLALATMNGPRLLFANTSDKRLGQ